MIPLAQKVYELVCLHDRLRLVHGLILTALLEFVCRILLDPAQDLWISELDLCLISKDVVNAVSYFKVDQDLRFPSDHAPVS